MYVVYLYNKTMCECWLFFFIVKFALVLFALNNNSNMRKYQQRFLVAVE